jgi:hypothetical protein
VCSVNAGLECHDHQRGIRRATRQVVRSREVLDAHDKAFNPRDDALDDRHSDAYVALMAARSTGPAEMAQHLRWMLDQLETSDMYDHQPIANVEALAAAQGAWS